MTAAYEAGAAEKTDLSKAWVLDVQAGNPTRRSGPLYLARWTIGLPSLFQYKDAGACHKKATAMVRKLPSAYRRDGPIGDAGHCRHGGNAVRFDQFGQFGQYFDTNHRHPGKRFSAYPGPYQIVASCMGPDQSAKDALPG